MSEKAKASFILASASPRRKELLRKAGYKFKVAVPDVDESSFYSAGISAEEYAKRLALAKAKNVAEKFPDYFVVGADTVVDCKGEIIGKAGDEKHAEEIIKKLFSQSHKVITGIAIVKLSDKHRNRRKRYDGCFPEKDDTCPNRRTHQRWLLAR